MTPRHLLYLIFLSALAASELQAQPVHSMRAFGSPNAQQLGSIGAQPVGMQMGLRRLPLVQATFVDAVGPSTLPMEPNVGDPYFDLDQHLDGAPTHGTWDSGLDEWQILPSGLIYKPYLAGQKSAGFSAQIVDIKNQGWTFDGKLGTQVGLLRHGNRDPIMPEGFQIDAEGSAQVRMNIPDDVDVYSVDFRAGLPITFGNRRHQTKLGYYHLSSHVGDEYLETHPTFTRLNYARDVLMFGQSYYWTERLRFYGEIDWAFYSDVSDPWELQFGVDYAPCGPTGFWGEPFFAFNTHLRQEVNFGGNFTFQFGWAWQGDNNSHLLRIGFHFLNGESPQYSFFDDHEQQIGFGVWYRP